VHAASVGELNAVLPLIARLEDARPDITVLVTTGTVTSANIAAGRLGPRALHQYAPIDTPQAVRGFLDHWRPDLAVFTESEVWPNLVMATSERGIPLTLVNARMSARSFKRWRLQRRIAKQLFGRFDLVLAQNAGLAKQFAFMGAPRTVATGNLKIDAPAPPVDNVALAQMRSLIGARPVWVAASTHEGEELIVADAHRIMRGRLPDLLTIIAPRHPQRGAPLAADFEAAGLRVALRSAGQDPSADTDIYLADTIGELGLFYSLSQTVLLGGSLVARGGQNPIEAIRLGCAVMSGPSRHNFADIYGGLDAAGAVVGVTGAADLAEAAALLITDAAARTTAAHAGELALKSMSGALDQTVAALLPLLGGSPAPVVAVAVADMGTAAEANAETPVAETPVQGLRRAVS
jgi:3-deoxy-D-manno-octulosonic-acid transferase